MRVTQAKAFVDAMSASAYPVICCAGCGDARSVTTEVDLAACFQWCKVFDLAGGHQTLSDSLLGCLFHGLKQHYTPDDGQGLLESELKLSVEFNNLRMLVRAFEVAHCDQCSIQTDRDWAWR